MNRAKSLEDNAQVARRYPEGIDDVKATLQKVRKLEAEKHTVELKVKDIKRALKSGLDQSGWAVVPEVARDVITASIDQLSDYQEQIKYWIKILEVSGTRMWAPSDFTRGDRVYCSDGWGMVKKVNPKSLTVTLDIAEMEENPYLKKYYSNFRLEYGKVSSIEKHTSFPKN